MTNMARALPARKGPRLSDANDAWLSLLGRLPVRLSDLRDPSDQEALATATRRGAIKLLLSGGTAFVARAR
jgi:hypothetical protein